MKIDLDYIPVLSMLPALEDITHVAYQCYLRYHNPDIETPAPSSLSYSATILQKGSFLRAVCLFVPILGNIVVYLFDRLTYTQLSDSLDTWADQSATEQEREGRNTAKDRILQCFWGNHMLLDLRGLRLTTLPDCIGNLSQLRELGLDNNQLTALPPEIGNLSQLKYLDLDNNQLTALPPEIGNLSQLRELDLKHNQLTALPREIGNLSQLRKLDLKHNQLTALPPEIGNLSQLRELELNGNQLEALPREIGNLSQLEYLYLKHNQLEALPREIGNLSQLKYLYLDNNQLTALPRKIGNLSRLRSLCLYNNQLTALPREIGNLSQLRSLDFSNNQLTELPPEIGNLSRLEHLNLNNNQLTALPPEIGNLSRLRSLCLRENPELSRLPGEMMALTCLGHLDVFGTPIQEDEAYAILINARNARNARATSVVLTLLKAFKGDASSISKQFPFLKDWGHTNIATLAEWLRRLKDTHEYQHSKIKTFTDTVVDIVKTAGSDPVFKDRFLNIADVNNTCCGDRAAMAFGEIYLEWRLHMLEASQASLEEKIHLLLRGALTLAVRAAMNETLPKTREVVEGFLYCEIEINKKPQFPLLTLSTDMLYARIGERAKPHIPAICDKALARFQDIFLGMDAFAKLVPESATSDVQKSAYEALAALDSDTLTYDEYKEQSNEIREKLEKDKLNPRKAWLQEQLGEGVLERLLAHPESWGRD